MPQRRVLALLLALVVLLADQLSKAWLLHQPGAAQGLPLLPDRRWLSLWRRRLTLRPPEAKGCGAPPSPPPERPHS